MQKIGYKTLLIVESPSKCKTIEKILGPAYMCVATCGHIRDLAIHADLSNLPDFISSPSSCIIPYTKSSKKIPHIRNIQSALSNCNGTVILATDADREGESIAWHVCQLFNLPVETTPRIVFKEITQSAIHTALKNPGRIDMNIVHAQQARQVIDFIIGYGVTPLLWKWMKSSTTSSSSTSTKTKVVQSAGRCQTPALRILYDAHTEMARSIANPTVKYKCIAYFTKYDIPFSLTIQLNPQDIEGFLYFYTNVETRRMVASQHIFTRSEPTTVSYKPPPALKSTTLQQMGSSHLKLAPSETMNIAQRLYESGYITYHRTESTCVSDEFKGSAHSFIRENWGDSYNTDTSIGNSNSKSNSPSDFAHEAIRPVNVLITTLPTNDELLGKNEQALYAFIWARAVCSCMANSIYDKITANVNVGSEYTYTRNEYRQKFAGWRACIARYGTKVLQQEKQQHAEETNSGQDSESDPVAGIDYFGYLQAIVSGSVLPYNTIECCPRITNTVAPYTYARLIHKLEKMGIGRPSTFASIVHTLKKREYIQHVQHCIDSDSNPANQAIKEHPRYFVSNYGEGAISTVISASSPKPSSNKNTNSNINTIRITPSGQRVIETLFPNCESLLAYNYTRDMEETLDEIAIGNAVWVKACTDCMDQLTALKREGVTIEKKVTFNLNTNATTKMNNTPIAPTPTAVPETGCIRTLNPYASIRDGKYGAYIFYKNPSMKKPKFISLHGFPYTYTECDIELLLHWIEKHI
jgi:DNA topoisomerase-1